MNAPLIALLAAGIALLLLAFVTRRPPVDGVPDLDGYFAAWGPLHGGYDPRTGTVFLRGWLTGTYRVCRPLARWGVQPDVLTLIGAWGVGAAAVVAGLHEGRHVIDAGPFWAGWLLGITAPLDNIDGCVAILTGRVTKWGYVLDSSVDRVCDGLTLVALWTAGAPVGLCIAAGAALGLLEYLRARAVGAGVTEVGVLSLGERPNRITAACLGLIAAGAVAPHRDALAGVGTAAVLGLSLIGLVQVGWFVRRRLTALDGASAEGATQGAPSQGGPGAPQEAPTSPATMPADSVTNGKPPPG